MLLVLGSKEKVGFLSLGAVFEVRGTKVLNESPDLIFIAVNEL